MQRVRFAALVIVIGGHSTLTTVTTLVGPAVSAAFLCVIGVLNLGVLAETLRGLRDGGTDAAAPGGLLSRVYARATRAVRAPWQMYPLGLLFGLGFDTATEVTLMVMAGSGAAAGLPWYGVLCLPLLFAAGMSLFDTQIGRAHV